MKAEALFRFGHWSWNAWRANAKAKTGALIVIANKNELKEIIRSGEKINARISSFLLETIFFKNTPLHDGAVVVAGTRIAAARCILPITERNDIDPAFGLRHRAAIGVSEATDALAIVVSEESGSISLAMGGELMHKISLIQLATELEKVMVEEVLQVTWAKWKRTSRKFNSYCPDWKGPGPFFFLKIPLPARFPWPVDPGILSAYIF